MIRSMTAYAGAALECEKLRAEIEIRGYNSRNLDIALKLPAVYQALEEGIRTAIAKRISRGRIEVRVALQHPEEAAESFEVNEGLAEGYYAALARLRDRLLPEQEIPLSFIAARNGLIEPAKVEPDLEATRQALTDCLEKALDTLMEMKNTEGRHTAADLEGRLVVIEERLREIKERAEGLLSSYQERLSERIRTLASGVAEIDPSRIAQEAAILADKSDISEEISRAASHLEQFRHLMHAPEPAGRPLNFLLQEFNREFTTMGNKVGSAEISHVIVSAKTELEKIREQVQNIE
jgi:uncharacterized protein (TIGR00255 family)